jgi:hypothetical protein
MPNVQDVVRTPVVDTGGRLEVRMTVQFNDGTADEPMLMHTTYKKHLMESYQGNEGYTPQAAPRNTVCRVGLQAFKSAFERYSDHLINQMKLLGTGITPNTIVYTDQSGVFFTSDCNIAGMDIHCFPCLPFGAVSTITFDLDTQQFGDMVKMLRFLYHAGDRLYKPGQPSPALSSNPITAQNDLSSKAGDAANAYQRQHAAVWFLAMFTEMERITLGMKLRVQPAANTANKQAVGAMLRKPSWP